MQRQLVKGERWIIDGNYSGTMDIRLACADTVFHRHRPRPDMNPGCRERLDREFLRWIWRFPVDERPGIVKKLEALAFLAPGRRVIRLNSPSRIAAFLRRLRQDMQRSALGE